MLANGCPTARRDGEACQARPTRSGYCLAHDPSLAEKRQQARLRGGYGKSRAARAQKILPHDLRSMDDVLSSAIIGVYRGNLLPSQGSAIAALSSARVRVREIALRMAEQGELRDRISALEDKINELGIRNHQNGKVTRRGL